MKEYYCFSAPGRSEIGGNHTDHQHGCVLAAAINLDATAKVIPNDTNMIRVFSEGYEPVEIDLNDLAVHPEEKNTSASLVRETAAAFAERGAVISGFTRQRPEFFCRI